MTGGSVAFEANEPFAFFDYFRVPHRLVEPGEAGLGITPTGTTGELWPVPRTGRRLLWCRPRRGSVFGVFTLEDMPLAGHVVPDEILRRELGADGWSPAERVRDSEGRPLASVWRHDDGSVLLPFDPGEVMTTLWSERYRGAGRSAPAAAARRLLLRTYYLVRPALPRGLQLRLRRQFTRVQGRAKFPRWPVEDGLHDLYAWLFAVLAELAGRPVPWLDLWPDGRRWALVLTHDVETDIGLRQRELLREPERELGLRSSWNLVAERYTVDEAVVRDLRADGCEIGVHGLRHDGRDLGSRRLLRDRLPAMRRAAQRWGAVGFRAPATQRSWEWMPDLGFAYDSSSTDTDPYEPQPGGCCTVLPFFNRDLVELPITLPQDHTVFAILGHADGRLWAGKARHIRDRGGMALVLTHPDYASDARVADSYRGLLTEFGSDPTAWCALPREVDAWWRRRAASTVRYGADGWHVAGPAAGEGRVRFGCPGAGRQPTAAGETRASQ